MNHRFEVTDKPIQMRVSCGVGVASPGKSPETAIATADRRLLIGKRRGRNQGVSKVLEGSWTDDHS